MMNTETESKQTFRSADEIAAIVRDFESCELPPASFNHRLHLTVACWYVVRLSPEEAAARMRTGLQRFIAHNGVDPQKYNETITLFWLRRIRALLDRAPAHFSPADAADHVLDVCDGRAVFDYYSKTLLDSPEARASWVEPDLKPLDF